eukprot:CAMPEP_0113626932 /NCGR_PEP_ID=MMETSP0017_2-20120614/13938_1 /TAXON_ID=2856 /ORGANISM="Cylindrotheca closterium" /LENGTH=348 /DNA_ID=CAMNT_0000537149 /DNA_START=8 /DNA_END=1051 /DNA_ORIENTATION=- /assembly_acc=CAM_ASM_000147
MKAHSVSAFLLPLVLVHCFINVIALSNRLSPSMSQGRVAVVTGASRGIGRGIAVQLGSEKFTVYALGRSSRKSSSPIPRQRPVAEGLDLTVESTAEEVTRQGGQGHAIACDLSKDNEIDRILAEIFAEEGRLDLVVCSAYSVPLGTSLRGNFWEQDMDMWDTVNGVGLRQVYAACRAAAPSMIETAKTTKETPLICLVSSFGGKSYTFNVAYGVGKCAIDRLATDMAYQLKKHGVASISLYPGLVKTEGNLQMLEDGSWDEASGGLDLSQGESPAFSGKAVVQLAKLKEEDIMERSGNVEVVAELANEFGFTDIDGSQPPSIRSLRYLLPNFVFPQIEKEAGKPIPQW